MTEELFKETLREWSEEARAPDDLASRVLRRSRRGRVRRVQWSVVLAGVTAAVVAVVLVVPGVLDRGPSDVMASPTQAAVNRETMADPGDSPPDNLIAAGDLAMWAYSIHSFEKVSADRQVLTYTWYLYDDGMRTYRETQWRKMDVAPGGENVAVLEEYPARRVGVLSRSTGAVRWIPLDQPVSTVKWSPDGTRLLLASYRSDPDLQGVMVNNSQEVVPADRAGYFLVDAAAGTSRFFPLPRTDGHADNLGVAWSSDGSLVWEGLTGEEPNRRYYDLEGRPAAAPPHEPETYQQAGLSPDRKRLAVENTDRSAVTAVRDLATGRLTPLRPVAGHWIEQLVGWADDDRLIAWACENNAEHTCVGSEFRNRLILVNADGTGLQPLSGFRENSQEPGTWEPAFSRR